MAGKQRHHINSKGESAPCHAEPGKCPLGGEHFDSAEEADKHLEKTMSDQLTHGVRKSKPTVEVYRHPQGKVATIRDGVLEVTKDGKVVKSSATIEKLRDGHGRWTKDNDASDSLQKEEEGVSDEEKAAKKDNLDRIAANGAAGYPVNSPYDSRNSGEITEMEPHTSRYDRPAAILPLNERGNPHKLSEMPVGSKLRFWNYKNSDGSETCDSTFEVWKDANGAEKYKAVVTASDTVYGRGSEQNFSHDQTGQRMGDRWTLVGAFQPIEGGGIIGDVPNRSMPIYTYK